VPKRDVKEKCVIPKNIMRLAHESGGLFNGIDFTYHNFTFTVKLTTSNLSMVFSGSNFNKKSTARHVSDFPVHCFKDALFSFA